MIPKLKAEAEEIFDKMLYNDGDKYHHCSHYVGKNYNGVKRLVKLIY